MCSALHYKSFLMHGIQTLLKPLRWSSLLFPLPPSYFHHSISTMLFQNSLRVRRGKKNLLWKKDFQPAKHIYIFTFGKCFQWVQPGNRFKGILFCCKIVFEWIGFCCGWLWVCWVAAIDMELCAWQLFWLFLQFVQIQLPYMGNRDVLYRLESFDILLFHVFTRVHQKLLNLQKN